MKIVAIVIVAFSLICFVIMALTLKGCGDDRKDDSDSEEVSLKFDFDGLLKYEEGSVPHGFAVTIYKGDKIYTNTKSSMRIMVKIECQSGHDGSKTRVEKIYDGEAYFPIDYFYKGGIIFHELPHKDHTRNDCQVTATAFDTLVDEAYRYIKVLANPSKP